MEIAGTEARDAGRRDQRLRQCSADAVVQVDGRIERRLAEVSSALADKKAAAAEAPVAQYCDRLNRLVSAVLVESEGGRA